MLSMHNTAAHLTTIYLSLLQIWETSCLCCLLNSQWRDSRCRRSLRIIGWLVLHWRRQVPQNVVWSSLQRTVAFSCLLITDKQGSCRNLSMFYPLLAYKLLAMWNLPDLSCLSSPKDLPQSKLQGKLHQNEPIGFLLLFCNTGSYFVANKCNFYTYFDCKIMRPYVTSFISLGRKRVFPMWFGSIWGITKKEFTFWRV